VCAVSGYYENLLILCPNDILHNLLLIFSYVESPYALGESCEIPVD
jgi:hypothetical protein